MRAREQFTDMFWLMKKSHPQLHKIMDELHVRAKEGDAEAQFSLAEKYQLFAHDSKFVDQGRALELYNQSAMQGHKEALKQLRMYAEKMNQFAAQYYLGVIYKDGNGVLIDNRYYQYTVTQGKPNTRACIPVAHRKASSVAVS